ncbi:hypothetical protein THAOC_26086, partial [Thalassiosira oceanica]
MVNSELRPPCVDERPVVRRPVVRLPSAPRTVHANYANDIWVDLGRVGVTPPLGEHVWRPVRRGFVGVEEGDGPDALGPRKARRRTGMSVSPAPNDNAALSFLPLLSGGRGAGFVYFVSVW